MPPTAALSEEPSVGSSGIRVIEGLMACMAVLCLGIFGYRKITGVKPISGGRRMRMIERISLASKTSLILAEVDGKEVVLAVGNEHVTFIDVELRGLQEREYLCETENEELHTVS